MTYDVCYILNVIIKCRYVISSPAYVGFVKRCNNQCIEDPTDEPTLDTNVAV